MICVEKMKKYEMNISVGGGGDENVSKASNEQPNIRSPLIGEERAQQLEAKPVKILVLLCNVNRTQLNCRRMRN